MRLVTWNCGGAFHQKWPFLMALAPDLAVVQECSETSVRALPEAFSACFLPAVRGKGLAVIFRKTAFQVTALQKVADLVAAFDVRGQSSFRLIAVWTRREVGRGYEEEMHKALDHHFELVVQSPCVVMGDWNSNSRWDSKRKKRTHSDLVRRLSEAGIESAYHHGTGEPHGAESVPTFFLYRHPTRPYHIDYLFASADLLQKLRFLHIEPFHRWKKLSDHVPLVAELIDADQQTEVKDM